MIAVVVVALCAGKNYRVITFFSPLSTTDVLCKQKIRMFVPTIAPMTDQIVPGVRDPGVVFTGQLRGDGSIGNTTTEPQLAYASVTRRDDVRSSPFVTNVPCRCGSRGPDNTCVTGKQETMPYEATTQAQKEYLNGLWDVRPYMTVGPTDRYMMLREAPVKSMMFQPQGPMVRNQGGRW